MSYNKYNEFMLCRYNYPGGPYFLKVNGKTLGLEPGDESEHLVPPYALEMLPLCGLHIVLHCGIIMT